MFSTTSLAGFSGHFASRYPELVGRRILVALSGGPDSVALLHLMRDPNLDLHLEAAHVHHGTRGAEADRDADFCRALCATLAVPFHLLRLQPSGSQPDGREATWRRLRYRALLDLVRNRGLAAVATGHQRNDVAEGVLVQLLRGGGPRALAGIAATTRDLVIRPLLPWSRDAIVRWLSENGLDWCEDSSNLDRRHLRNRVRHDLLPTLQTASPAFGTHLVHLADTLARDEAYFATELGRRALWIDPWEPDGGVPVGKIRDLAPPLRSRWLHAQASRIGLSRVSRRQLDLFEQLVETADPRAVTLEKRWRVYLGTDRLWLEPPHQPPEYETLLRLGATKDLAYLGWGCRLVDRPTEDQAVRWRRSIRPGGRLTVRSPAPGDLIKDGKRSRKVRRLLATRLPRHLRQRWPVFCDDDIIYWIPGVWQGPAGGCRGGPVAEVFRR